jgi:hypothetical protein
MSTPKQSILSRQSTSKLTVLGIVLVLLSILIATYPTLTFVKGFTMGTLHPIAEFESGEDFSFVDDDPYSSYLLSMSVSERNAPIPEMEVSIETPDGEVVTESINRWNSVMGREYKQFLKIAPVESGKLRFRIDAEENEDFLLFRSINDVLDRELGRAIPIWLVALVPLMIAVGILGVILVRFINASSEINLHVSKP